MEKKDSMELVPVALTTTELVELSGNLGKFMDLARAFYKAGMFPNIPNEFAALASIEAGRELGVPPIMALQTIYPIKGRLTIEAKTMLALFQGRGGQVMINRRDPIACEVQLSKHGFEEQTFSFTMEEAKQAGLTGKDNWRNYPSDMLFARCVSRAIRSFDPGSVLGMYSREEVEDMGEAEIKVIEMPKIEVVPAPPKEPVGKIVDLMAKEADEGVVIPQQEAAKAQNSPAKAAKKAKVAPEPVVEEKPATLPETQVLSDMHTLCFDMATKLEKDYGRTNIRGVIAERLNIKNGKSYSAENVMTCMTIEEASWVLKQLEVTLAKASEATGGR